MYNQQKNKTIEKYIDIMNKIILNGEDVITSEHIVNNYDITKDKFSVIQSELEEKIRNTFLYVQNKKDFCVSLFVMRSKCRILMNVSENENDIESYTQLFKVFSYLFFVIRSSALSISVCIVSGNEDDTIKILISLANTHLLNSCNWRDKDFKDSDVIVFYNRIRKISIMSEDQHSYSVKNEDLSLFLNNQGINQKKLKRDALELLVKNKFISTENISSNRDWSAINRLNLADSKDDILIVSKSSFLKLSKDFQNFINNFESNKCKKATDPENDLIFAFKTNQYLYILKFCMEMSQSIIETFWSWAQYSSLMKYYYNINRNEKVLKKYNQLMTYKIADILMENGYILPLETKKYTNKLKIPRIEIKKYGNKEDCKKLGDIDVLFYSPYTSTIYILEYKNLQMFVSGAATLTSDIYKIEREDTVSKTLNRKNYIQQHQAEIIFELFQIDNCNCEIKAVLLTTKPTFYFFKNPINDYMYFDWIEFKEKLEKHEL